jgi:hypothetical protein
MEFFSEQLSSLDDSNIEDLIDDDEKEDIIWMLVVKNIEEMKKREQKGYMVVLLCMT